MEIVTIIVPVYNSEKHILECLDSLVNQTYKHLEIILIDDGSRDNSILVCENILNKDVRVRVITQENKGVSSARNKGILNANGDFIVFVDSDDTLSEFFVETLLFEMKSNKADVVYSNYNIMYGNKIIPRIGRMENKLFEIGELHHKLLDDGTLSGILFGSVWSALYKTSIIKNNIFFDKNIKINEDGVFNIQYCLSVNRILYLEDIRYYNYRQISNSASNQVSMDIRTTPATQKVKEIYSEFGHKNHLDFQLDSRHISEVFWTLLNISQRQNTNPNSKIINQMNLLLNSLQNSEYNSLDLGNMSVYKKVIIRLMKKKRAYLLFFMFRYVKPILEKKIQR